MIKAVTLVHQSAMPIGVHAVRTFTRHFAGRYQLDIHTDGSLDEANQRILLDAAAGMDARIVTPAARKPILEERLADYPKTRALLDGVGYNAKLELPMAASGPYFYFDSDIVWLRPVTNLRPEGAPNAFSTESWSWYNGVANDRLWIKAKVPRRVNSGFYFLGEPFPFERMEDMLVRGMFDPKIRYNTDQEIMAYLFRDMQLYHPEDLKRSRRNVCYDLKHDTSAALHFPGGMWLDHLDQMQALEFLPQKTETEIRHRAPVPLTSIELLRMRCTVAVADSPVMQIPANLYRMVRRYLDHIRA